jgi:hypothetical protein
MSDTSPKDQAALRFGARPFAERQAQPGEVLFEFYVRSSHTFYRCVLRDHDEFGVEAQFLDPVDLRISRTFGAWLDPTRTPREMAIMWANEQRKAMED